MWVGYKLGDLGRCLLSSVALGSLVCLMGIITLISMWKCMCQVWGRVECPLPSCALPKTSPFSGQGASPGHSSALDPKLKMLLQGLWEPCGSGSQPTFPLSDPVSILTCPGGCLSGFLLLSPSGLRHTSLRATFCFSLQPPATLSLFFCLIFPHQDMAPPSLRGSSWELGVGVTLDDSFPLPCTPNSFTSPVNFFFFYNFVEVYLICN